MVCSRPRVFFLFVGNQRKWSIPFERARAGDFPMYHEYCLKVNYGKSGIRSKLGSFMTKNDILQWNIIIAHWAKVESVDLPWPRLPNRFLALRSDSEMVRFTLEWVFEHLNTVFPKCKVESSFSWSTFIYHLRELISLVHVSLKTGWSRDKKNFRCSPSGPQWLLWALHVFSEECQSQLRCF